MAALIRAVGRLRKSPPAHAFCCAASANEKLQVRGVNAAAAGAATARAQPPRANPALSSGSDATKNHLQSLRSICHIGGDGCNAQCSKVVSILQDMQKTMEESDQRDEAILALLKTLVVQRTLHVSEDQGCAIIALLHRILARQAEKADMAEAEKAEGEKAEKSEKAEMAEGEKAEMKVTETTEKVEVMSAPGQPTWGATIRKGYVLAMRYKTCFKPDAEDSVVYANMYDLLHDEDFQVFCQDLWQLLKESKARKDVCSRVASVWDWLMPPSTADYTIFYVVGFCIAKYLCSAF